MPVVLTTIPSGDPINADTLRGLVLDVEKYVNEAIAATDRGSSWLTSNHVYRPDFYGAPDPRTTLVSGEIAFRSRGLSDPDRAFFTGFLGTGPFPIPGLNATVQIPETLDAGTYYYRLVMAASFYVYEWGGNDDDMDEYTAANQAATFNVSVNGVIQAGSDIRLWKGSKSQAYEDVAYYPRKQASVVWASAGMGADLNVGVNNIGIVVSPQPVAFSGGAVIYKHIIVQQGNMLARYRLR